MECMSRWVWSLLSCCHLGFWPGAGELSGYGLRFHPLVGGVIGVRVLGLVTSGSVEWRSRWWLDRLLGSAVVWCWLGDWFGAQVGPVKVGLLC